MHRLSEEQIKCRRLEEAGGRRVKKDGQRMRIQAKPRLRLADPDKRVILQLDTD